MKSPEDIAGKTVQGSLYSGTAAMITFVLGFIRSILLARLLLPEHFGAMTLAVFFISIIRILCGFGLNSAFIHCQDEGEALKRTYFSLRVGLEGIIMVILLAVAPILQQLYPNVANLREVLTSLTIISFVSGLSVIQTTLMHKELAFLSLAATEIVSSVVMTIVAPLVGWLGWGIWALVVERVCDVFPRFILVWGPFCRWRPRFGWDRQASKLFWRFGKPTWVKMNIDNLLDRFDDFWIGSALGQTPLGYYTKAYDFACAPRRVFAFPLMKVFVPVFARLQNDRKRLSDAFFRSAYLLIRMVFLGAGLFALVIPEFISQVIGEKWLPMVWTFRLLLGYAAFNSFLALMSEMLIVVGKPKVARNATLVQAAFFIPAVIVGAYLAGIKGVAIAADGMLFIGIWRLLHSLVKIIDFSVWCLLGWPVLALTTALGCGIALEWVSFAPFWQLALLKMGTFIMIFGGILLLVEGKEYLRNVKEVWNILKPGTMSKKQALQ